MRFRFSDNRFLMKKKRFLTWEASRPASLPPGLSLHSTTMLKKNKGVCHQIPHYGIPACWQTLLGLLLESCCFLPDWLCNFFLLPACCPRPATLLLLSSPAAFALDLRNGMQWDRFWILVVTIPALQDSCFFPISSIALLPFPISLIRTYNKLVGPTFEPLFLNLMPGMLY